MRGEENQTVKRYLIATMFLAVLVSAPSAYAKAPPESFADLADKLLPSVVNISTTQTVQGRGGPEFPQLPRAACRVPSPEMLRVVQMIPGHRFAWPS